MMKIKGQVQIGVMIGAMAISTVGGWFGGYFLTAPEKANIAIAKNTTDIAIDHQINLTQNDDIKDLKIDVKHMRDILDQWASRQGIITKSE